MDKRRREAEIFFRLLKCSYKQTGRCTKPYRYGQTFAALFGQILALALVAEDVEAVGGLLAAQPANLVDRLVPEDGRVAHDQRRRGRGYKIHFGVTRRHLSR